ncbi:hypothetical protein Pfo_031489 [Paulownia fortunei]|nr:hypothetical protein Pfo_031489 [Paulownia fortunei]
MDLHDVMDEMIIKRSPIAIVVDEYGGTSGLITDKDIYEELFGTVRDEIDDVSDDYIEKLGDHRFKVSGKMTLYDFERYFDKNIKELENDDAVTLTDPTQLPDFREENFGAFEGVSGEIVLTTLGAYKKDQFSNFSDVITRYSMADAMNVMAEADPFNLAENHEAFLERVKHVLMTC